MNIWIKRSLTTVAVSGGLVLAGAATAHADEQRDSSNQTDSSLSVPIEIGGLSLGSSSESSSSSSSTNETRDGDRSTTQHDSSEQRSASGGGIEVDPSRIDLGGMLSSSGSSQEESRGGDRGRGESSQSSQSQSQSEGSVSAPVELGGVKVHGHQADESRQESSSSAQDGDRTHEEHRASSDSSRSEGGLDTGGIALDPRAALGSSQQQSDSSLGGRDGIAESDSSSHTEGSLAAPIVLEGISGWFTADGTSSQEGRTHSTDGDRSSSSEHASTDHRSTDTRFGGGGLALHPHGSFSQHQSDSEASVGGTDGVRESDSASSTAFAGGTPYVFEGIWGDLVTTEESTSTETHAAADGDREVSSTESESSQQDTRVSGHSGQAAGDPTLGFLTEQSDSSSGVGDLDESRSAGTTGGGYDAPFAFGGFGALVEQGSADHHSVTDTVRDGDRTTTEQHSSHQEDRDGRDLTFDGFSGHPEGWFSSEDLTELLSADRS